jgi:hypothetical protein
MLCWTQFSTTGCSEIRTWRVQYFQEFERFGETTTTEPKDWRTPLVCYLETLGYVIDRKVRRQDLKYVLLDHGLYRRTIYGLLLTCLSSDQSKIAIGEFMMKYAVHISQFIWDDWLLWQTIFLVGYVERLI